MPLALVVVLLLLRLSFFLQEAFIYALLVGCLLHVASMRTFIVSCFMHMTFVCVLIVNRILCVALARILVVSCFARTIAHPTQGFRNCNLSIRASIRGMYLVPFRTIEFGLAKQPVYL